MWFMPSYGRPERLRELLDAPGGWPLTVWVLINKDDPERERYQQVYDSLLMEWRDRERTLFPFTLCWIPAGSRCADAHRWISEQFPDQSFYGLLCDDHWPITPGWHEKLVEAAGTRKFAIPNGEPSFPHLIRSAVVIGGDIVKAMGSLVPCEVKHNFEDNVWDTVAGDFGLLVPLWDVFVEHKHWIHGTAGKDETYQRGSADFHKDQAIFDKWRRSPERCAMNERIADVLGVTISQFNPDDVHLAIMSPIQDDQVDAAYHASLTKTLIHLREEGVRVTLMENTGGSNIGKARERLLWNAYYHDPKPTHFMLIDADMEWDPGLITRFLATGHDFVAAVGVQKIDTLKLCCNFLPNPQRIHSVTKFLEVRDVGAAFVLLKRSVVERMMAAYPELRYDADRPEYALFMEMIDKTEGEYGIRLSEDLSFCRRWRAIGGQIWADPRAMLGHAGRKIFYGRLSDVFEYPAAAAPADAVAA